MHIEFVSNQSSTCRRPARRLSVMREWHMRLKVCLSVAALLLMSMVMLGSAVAQSSSDETPQKIGNYLATGDFQVGYRFNYEKGVQLACPVGSPNRNAEGYCPEESMYDTLVNLHSGGRLLEQSLSLRAPDRNGLLFDDLSISSFGWGGDPNNVARVRVSKHRLYDFNATYRRDQNFFDYDLLANPLNPPAFTSAGVATGSVPVEYSPHQMSLARRMTDADLTLAPESPISLRLGFNRVRNEGPAFSTLHEGSEALLLENVSTTTDRYQIGVDVKLLPRTKISYDQFVEWYKGDTTAQEGNLYSMLPNGTFTDFGIAYTPCTQVLPTGTIVGFPSAAAGSPVISGCITPASFTGASALAQNQFLSYNRANRIRTHTPTEQVSLQSHYFKNLDVTGRYSYAANDMSASYDDLFTGLETRTSQVGELLAGPENGKIIQSSADFGATYHITAKLSISDTFHFMNWRAPAFFDATDVAFDVPTSGVAAPAGCSSATCVLFPLGSAQQAATLTDYSSTLQTITKSDQVEADYEFSRMAGAHIGYRYDHVAIVNELFSLQLAGGTEPPASYEPIIDTDTALAGFWLRPNDKWRFNADASLGSANNWEFRTDPRRQLEYSGRLTYTPTRWATITGTGRALEQRNRGTNCDSTGTYPFASCNANQNPIELAFSPAFNNGEVAFNAHNRNLGVAVTLMPNDKFGFDFAYNYSNIGSNSFICFQEAGPAAPPVFTITFAGYLTPTTNGISPCATAPLTDFTSATGTPLYETYELYRNRVHFADAMFVWKPFARFSANMGYDIVNSEGLTTNFNTLQPLGSLASTFHRPVLTLEYQMAKNWAVKGGWNYYDYNEKDVAGPTLPRDFHDNMTTLSLKYAF